MSKENKKRLHTVCGIVTAVLVLIVGICLILSCLSIYQSGEKPFSPESVAAHFKAIRIPVIACIAAVAVSAVLALILPVDVPKTQAIREEADILAAMKAKAGTLTNEELAKSKMKRKNSVMIARCALCAVAVAFIVLGIFNGGIQDVLGKAIAICTECIGLG